MIRGKRFETIDFRGHLDSNIDALDDCGRILGVYWDADRVTTHGYVRHANGQVSTLDVPGAAATVVFAVNDRDQLAGYFTDATGALHGFVKSGQYLQQLDVPGGVATIVTSLNIWGSVAANTSTPAGCAMGSWPPRNESAKARLNLGSPRTRRRPGPKSHDFPGCGFEQ